MDKDILILGAGPSGLSTALHLAKDFPHLAPRVLILEKERHPRPKLCAGGLVVDAEIILERLGLNVAEIPHVDAHELHFDFEGKGLRLRAPEKQALRVIRRDEFDAWLAEKAESRGIEIREGVTVKSVQPRENGVIVETDAGTFTAGVVVGADGSNGVTRRCILPNAPVYTARVLEALTPVQPLIAKERNDPKPRPDARTGNLRVGLRTPRNDAAFLDFFPVPENIAGYIWDFPTQVKGRPMRCWGAYDTNLLANGKRPQLKDALAQEMRRHGFDLNDYEIQGHPIRWYHPSNPLSAPRVLLVGDAAGADPLFGEGISIALGYGALAAREIGESFQRDEFSFDGYRRRLARSGLGRTLWARWFISQVVYTFKWRWFQILLWRIVKPLVAFFGWRLVLNWSKRLKA